MKSVRKVLFLGKADDLHCIRAAQFCQAAFQSVDAYFGSWGDEFPKDARKFEGDLILSYLSRWVVPSSLLERARMAAINFHPAPPEYPGIGCVNFALYEGASQYGTTCHHMSSKVDTGSIIAVKRFPIFPFDTVASLLGRTYDFQLALFHEILAGIIRGERLPQTEDVWARPPISRREFNALCALSIDMDEHELSRRIKATTFGSFKPVLIHRGFSFEPKI